MSVVAAASSSAAPPSTPAANPYASPPPPPPPNPYAAPPTTGHSATSTFTPANPYAAPPVLTPLNNGPAYGAPPTPTVQSLRYGPSYGAPPTTTTPQNSSPTYSVHNGYLVPSGSPVPGTPAYQLYLKNGGTPLVQVGTGSTIQNGVVVPPGGPPPGTPAYQLYLKNGGTPYPSVDSVANPRPTPGAAPLQWQDPNGFKPGSTRYIQDYKIYQKNGYSQPDATPIFTGPDGTGPAQTPTTFGDWLNGFLGGTPAPSTGENVKGAGGPIGVIGGAYNIAGGAGAIAHGDVATGWPQVTQGVSQVIGSFGDLTQSTLEHGGKPFERASTVADRFFPVINIVANGLDMYAAGRQIAQENKPGYIGTNQILHGIQWGADAVGMFPPAAPIAAGVSFLAGGLGNTLPSMYIPFDPFKSFFGI